ncbi:conjugal transfer protein TraD [Sphingomonas sp. DC2300-3]|uniref:conjugal transfer protein TraD n=1 Tax=unclassified Sphingomonas TaxID=196159 RepID=UPI003CECCE6E
MIACKADALPVEMLAGALLEAAGTKDIARQAAWHARGAAFFRGGKRGENAGAAPGGDTAPGTSPAGDASSAGPGAEPRQ